MKKADSTSMSEIVNCYKERNRGFDEMGSERTASELAYDNEILEALRKGSNYHRSVRYCCSQEISRRSAAI
jgi:hypothetical protein